MVPRLLGRLKSLAVPSGAILAALALVAVAGTVWRMRAIALEDAQRETGSLAFVLAEQTTRSLQAIDIVLADLGEHIQALAAGSPDDLTTLVGTPEIHALLRQRLGQLPQAQELAVIGETGRLTSSSNSFPAPPLDVADREHFAFLRTHRSLVPFIGAPVDDRITGQSTIFIARRMNRADGGFLGVILARLNISYLKSIFDSINLPHQESFLLLRRDGVTLVRYPDAQHQPGERLPAGSPWYEAVQKGAGFFITRAYFDDQIRLVSTQPLAEYPLVVNATVKEEEILGPWRRDSLIIFIGSALMFGYAIMLVRINRRQLSRVRQSKASLMHRNRELAELSVQLQASEAHLLQKSQQLQTTLSTMDQGLMMIDGAGCVTVCNSRARDLLDVPGEIVDSHPPFTEILDYQWRVNRSGHAGEDFEAFVRARTDFEHPGAQELRRPSGRVIEVRSVPLKDGGAVRTYTDITERKAREERDHYFARHDDLTRLVNRAAFRERLDQATALADGDRRGLALFYLDLDRFKQVNDAHGHRAGDAVLLQAAQRIQAAVRSVDTVARIGGDEFAIILPYLDDPDSAACLAERLIEALNMPFVAENAAFHIGVSIGIAFFPEHGRTTDSLTLQADRALYQAKARGRNTFVFGKSEAAPAAAPVDA